MRSFLITFIYLLFFSISAKSQSDLLVLKKHNRTVKSFYPGNKIIFSTEDRAYYGYITSIRRDSVFIVQYDIRQFPVSWGSYVLDTVGTYYAGVNYKDIILFGKESKGFNWSGSGAALMGGGVLLTTAGLVTWVFAKPNTRYFARPSLVIGGAALAGVGYLLSNTGRKGTRIGKKYSLHYIQIN